MNRKLKWLIVPVFIVFLLCMFTYTCVAEDSSESGVTEQAQAVFSELLSSLEEETKAALSEIGIDDADYTQLLSLSPKRVVDAILELLTGKMPEKLKAVGFVCALLVLNAVLEGFAQPGSTMHSVFSVFTTLLIVVSLLLPVSESLVQAFSAMELSSNFLLAYIPAFSGVISMSGKPLSSAAYSSVMIGLSNLLAQCNVKVFLPVVQVFFSLNIASSVQPKYAFNSLVAFCKKAVTVLLGFSATIFTGLLAIKGSLASAGDSVAVRGVKMLVGSAVPVVGSALSDAYTSVLGSITLIQNAVGIFGIVVFALMHVPVILDLLLWYLALSFTASVSEALGQKQAATLLNGITSTVSLVNTLVIFTAFILIISTGIMLNFKN